MNDDFPRDISILLCCTKANNPNLASCLGGDAGYIPIHGGIGTHDFH